MTNETGESCASIYARMDKEALPAILDALKAGATLLRPSRLKNYYTQCRDDRDPNHGRGISARLVKQLETQGVLVRCGVDRYQLGELPEPQVHQATSAEAQLPLF